MQVICLFLIQLYGRAFANMTYTLPKCPAQLYTLPAPWYQIGTGLTLVHAGTLSGLVFSDVWKLADILSKLHFVWEKNSPVVLVTSTTRTRIRWKRQSFPTVSARLILFSNC